MLHSPESDILPIDSSVQMKIALSENHVLWITSDGGPTIGHHLYELHSFSHH
jgi:hypothetical protein